jgi:translation initiation factor 1
MDICPKCGLPLQACVCEEIAKTEQRIHVRTEKKRFGKLITVIRSFQNS